MNIFSALPSRICPFTSEYACSVAVKQMSVVAADVNAIVLVTILLHTITL